MSIAAHNTPISDKAITTIVLTPGEPAGIGPDIAISLSRHELDLSLAVIANRRLFNERAKLLGIELELVDFQNQPHQPGRLSIIDMPCEAESIPGRLSIDNARYVLDCIDRAVDGCLHGTFDALVTGPVHKGVINDAGIDFTGHTEWLAQRAHVRRPVMMLATEDMRVALVTTHLPLAAVPTSITKDDVVEVSSILHDDLLRLYRIEDPVIGVCGLNPHAGENGYLGREEIDIIQPAINVLRDMGKAIIGPLPADTAFTERQLKRFDAVLAMYHDQGLPVIKHAGFGKTVNVTLGLPFIRTSVDHGTALEFAASGKADENSLLHAIEQAKRFAKNVRDNK